MEDLEIRVQKVRSGTYGTFWIIVRIAALNAQNEGSFSSRDFDSGEKARLDEAVVHIWTMIRCLEA